MLFALFFMLAVMSYCGFDLPQRNRRNIEILYYSSKRVVSSKQQRKHVTDFCSFLPHFFFCVRVASICTYKHSGLHFMKTILKSFGFKESWGLRNLVTKTLGAQEIIFRRVSANNLEVHWFRRVSAKQRKLWNQGVEFSKKIFNFVYFFCHPS